VGAARAALQPLAMPRAQLSRGDSRVLEISVLSRYPLWRELAQRFTIRSALVVPIRSSDDDRGVLCFCSTQHAYFSGAANVQFGALGRWCYDVMAYDRARLPRRLETERDQLTRLLSHRQARRELEGAWRYQPDHSNRGVLLLIDIDGLKHINAACGTRVGDLALQHLARTIEPLLRRSDVIARWGDDEILAWLPAEPASTAATIAERLRWAVLTHPPDALVDQAALLRVSIGATAVPVSDSLSNALDRLNQALLRAKQNGGNGVCVAQADF
jgi:diguanylate cyclase (GGDEF)-like protein